MNLTYNDIKHEYQLDGMIIPSVTQVLKGAGLVNLDFIDKDLLAEKADLGHKVHSTTELYDLGTLDLFSLHPTLSNYLDSWVKFRKDFNFQPTEIELKLHHELYRFAGTVDRIGTMNNELILLDIKSGKKFRTHEVQTAAYKLLFDQGKKKTEKIKKRYAVYLSEHGYKLEPHTDTNDTAVFLAALTINNYLRQTK